MERAVWYGMESWIPYDILLKMVIIPTVHDKSHESNCISYGSKLNIALMNMFRTYCTRMHVRCSDDDRMLYIVYGTVSNC